MPKLIKGMTMDSQICWIVGTSWPCLTPSEWAAWAQAISATVALAIAIAVPWWQRRQIRRDALAEKEIQKHSIAQALLGPLEDVRSAAAHLRAELHDAEFEKNVIALDNGAFTVLPEFHQFRPQLYLLGQVGQDINLVLTNLIKLRHFVREAKRLNYVTAAERDSVLPEVQMVIHYSTSSILSLCKLTGVEPRGTLPK